MGTFKEFIKGAQEGFREELNSPITLFDVLIIVLIMQLINLIF